MKRRRTATPSASDGSSDAEASRAAVRDIRSWRASLPEPPQLRDVILSSWKRSFAAGLERDGAVPFRRVGDAELETILERNRELVDVAVPHIELISALLSGVEHLVYVTDANGIVLHTVGDLSRIDELHLSPGHDWSERTMGTNGAGTAIAADRPIAVIGPEHFAAAFEERTCTGAPIHRGGRVVGAIDVSTAAADAAPDRTALVAHVAFVIDRELALLDEARRQELHLNAEQRERQILQEANARKERFIAALAHELRSPIMAIMAAADVLEDSPGDVARVESAGGVVMRQAAHVAKVIEQLLDAARVASMRLHLNRSRVDLRLVLEQAMEAVRPAVQAKRQKLAPSMPAAPVLVHGDMTRLIRVFVNLLDNASRYSEKDRTIWLTASQSDGEAVVSVRDDGCGIAPEALPKVFDLLFQADGESSADGLGLGLSLVRGIAEAHGGRVAVYSDGVGRGSEFVVRIPRRG